MNVSQQKFNRYEILAELGVGGMATVYRAYDPLFEREVALKVLKRELLEDPELRERFTRETKIIAKLEHAAIVPVYDVGHDNEQLFYVMRYMSGGSLADRIAAGDLDLDQTAHILLRLADALDYAHRKGVVHRDLKPANILFDEVGNAFISDFGIAKFAQAATRITHSGIIGTPRYMSPEQARGEETDGRSDLYSLAVLLFEILSGRAPFEATTPLALAFKHATEPPPDLLTVNPSLPAELGVILKKAMAKEPDDRYNTCAEFANAFLEALPANAAPNAKLLTPLPLRTPPPRRSEAPTQAPVAKPASRSRKNRWMTAGIAALILLLLGLWTYRGAQTSTPPASPSDLTTVTVTNVPPSPTPSPTAPPTLTATVTPSPTAVPLFAPGGAVTLAFTSNREVYLMDMEGKTFKQLTNSRLPKFDLQWVPGGNDLLYGEGQCVYQVNAEAAQPQPERLFCFNAEYFEGFRLSHDGKFVAISIERRLIVVPYDPARLATTKTAFELQRLPDLCVNYPVVAVKSAQWSADGKRLALLYQSAIGQRIGNTVRILQVDLERCKAVDPLVIDEFPAKYFIPEGYANYPLIPSYHWDGGSRFLFNTFIRNGGYGMLYLFDISSTQATLLNPVQGKCCYRSATFSPDGTYILFAFQDRSLGANSRTELYYIPLTNSGDIAPFRLPLGFFTDLRENILFALRPPPQP
ncbi:MAG: protein kinase domain-containing protein [Chloroflexota bacterium]|nr:protein kinase [Chloroflexota bacterium]MBI5702308.1 protein kinase [Chloroflexota bacterium]